MTFMSVGKQAIRGLMAPMERSLTFVDRLVNQMVQPRRARGNLVIQPYVGWGSPTEVELRGRVLLPRTTTPPRLGDARSRNFANMMRRMCSREVGGVAVSGEFRGVSAMAVTDNDGYFLLHFKLPQPAPAGWHEIRLGMQGRSGQTPARLQVISEQNSDLGVISDLDDTVIRSDVRSLPRMLMTAMTGNARSRLPFPGVGAFYRGLLQGEHRRNPIFYVSSSPWNFFDLLWQFLAYRQIPLGPMFLRNWGLDLLKGHSNHKHNIIEEIFARFPEMKFVLVGDSSEADPQIYADVVRRHPGRVIAVYIRDIAGKRRGESVMRLREEVQKAGVELVLAADSLHAAAHAMALGLLTPDQLQRVHQAVSDEEHFM